MLVIQVHVHASMTDWQTFPCFPIALVISLASYSTTRFNHNTHSEHGTNLLLFFLGSLYQGRL